MTRSRRPRAIALAAAAAALLAPVRAPAFPLDHLATTDDIGLHKVPHEGESHILVIPSRVGTTEFPASRLASLRQFFDPAGGPGTFRTYWQIVSNGRYDPIPTLVEPVLFPDECPIAGKPVDDCTISIDDDIGLIGRGEIGDALTLLLERVRDEQGIDLGQFDANGATPGQPDGYFDGIIIDSDIYSGVGFPLAALGNTVVVGAAGPEDPDQLTCGIVAMVPPNLHEYGHVLGFADLYGGPTVNCLMADLDTTLSAFSRQQIGWGEVVAVSAPQTIELRPVLDGGQILRFGAPPQYVLVENRGGPHHADLEDYPAGIYVYSIDEAALPFGPLGFLDPDGGRGIYLPNKKPPYLDVNLPLRCNLGATSGANACALTAPGQSRHLAHASGLDFGLDVRIDGVAADGTITLAVVETPAEEGGGCRVAPGRAVSRGPFFWLVLVALVSAAATRRGRGTAADRRT